MKLQAPGIKKNVSAIILFNSPASPVLSARPVLGTLRRRDAQEGHSGGQKKKKEKARKEDRKKKVR